MLKALIFDMDGVLANTGPIHFESWVKLANEIGKNFTKEFFERMLDLGFIVREYGDLGRKGQYVRITIGTTEENEKFIEALKSL